eukprot:SAG31_NODE_927_length_10930_cov_15.134983_3_plen_572_part_00
MSFVKSRVDCRKRGALKFQAEMQARQAVHRDHMIKLSHAGATGVSSDDGLRWLGLSELPLQRLVWLVFETIDADHNGSLDKDEIASSAFGSMLEPHWTKLDVDGDGEISPNEWFQFFKELESLLGEQFGVFLVDLAFQAGMAASELSVSADHASRLIQRVYRGWRGLKLRNRRYEAVVQIQACCRMAICRRRHSVYKAFAARINKAFRAFLSRKALLMEWPAAATRLADARVHMEASPATASFLAAQAKEDQEDWQAAIECYDKALKLAYGRPARCHNGKAVCFVCAGKHREAIDEFSAAIECDPHDGRAWRNRATAAAAIGDLQRANADAIRGNILCRLSARSTPRLAPAEPLQSTEKKAASAHAKLRAAVDAENVALVRQEAVAIGRCALDWMAPHPTKIAPLGTTALGYAVEKSKLGSATVLVSMGVAIDQVAASNVVPGGHGPTPLYVAARAGDLQMVRMLLQHRADPNIALAPAGYTPLHIAAENGSRSICWALLAGGADANARVFAGMQLLTPERLCFGTRPQTDQGKADRVEVLRLLGEFDSSKASTSKMSPSPLPVAPTNSAA